MEARNVIVVRYATSRCERTREARFTLTNQFSTKKHITEMKSSSYDFPPISRVVRLWLTRRNSISDLGLLFSYLLLKFKHLSGSILQFYNFTVITFWNHFTDCTILPILRFTLTSFWKSFSDPTILPIIRFYLMMLANNSPIFFYKFPQRLSEK